MQDHHPQSAPDYTNAALVMLFVNLLWVFALILALFGFLALISVGYALNWLITRFARHKARNSVGFDGA
ncbi:hypothetical protein KUH32_02260 [Thalassococcus sp. CAU 1522]|uniref:Histidinol phosphate aminotransferase n=1 Tax=Thalassococcus arenae TaxID=2851652 RepID=A0ABS6N4P6_9RHOB|nr:hypothetical protein [Thalassococcus arenae]MBV2358584.1 hypothetical protein [Thalassococcus arenae]